MKPSTDIHFHFIFIVIPIVIISFCGGYWLNEYLNQRYNRNESMVMFIRGLQIGQERGWLTVHDEKMARTGDARLLKTDD